MTDTSANHGGYAVTSLRSNIGLSSFSVLGDLIFEDEIIATEVFSDLCGLDPDLGLSAIRNFRRAARRDRGLLHILSALDGSMVTEQPESVMCVLVDGFGLCELDALDVIMRLAATACIEEASQLQSRAYLN